MSRYQEGAGFKVWPGLFHVTRVNNSGAAFGLFQGNTPALTLISLVCVAGLAVVLIRDLFLKFESTRYYAFSFVAAGAAGNLYDRAFYGYVVDFLDFRIWPVFNVADSFICMGIFLMIVSLFKPVKFS